MPTTRRFRDGRHACVVRATAPVRTCDIGGWTDTWFGGPGRVLNVAVSPGIEVVVRPAEGTASTAPDDRLVRAALERYPPPRAVEVGIQSGVPAGSALGTSAAVAVALLAALLELRGQRTEVHEVAAAAHLLETEVIGEESGVQDQLGAAYGGISYIRVDDYPNATVETLPRWEELGELMTVVYLGHPHVSSEVHREVIRSGDREVFGLLREAVAAGRSRCCIHQRDCARCSSSVWPGTDPGRCSRCTFPTRDWSCRSSRSERGATVGQTPMAAPLRLQADAA